MGNGPRLVIDIETSNPCGEVVLGPSKPMIFMGGMLFNKWESHPEYSGTYWADVGRMSKREQRVAGLQTLLVKLGVLKLTEDEWASLASLTMKRLKRAKWAKYQKSSK